MRRLLLLLLAVVLGAGVLASPVAAQTPVPGPTTVAPTSTATSPTPTPTPRDRVPLRLTLADDGRTVTVPPGTALQVELAGTPGVAWEGLDEGAATLATVRWSSSVGQPLRAELDALSPGRYGGLDAVRPQTLAARQVAACERAAQPCVAGGRSWSVQVVVEDGPPHSEDPPCRPVAVALPSPPEGSQLVTRRDDGRTVTVVRGGYVDVFLDLCDPQNAVPRVAGLLHRESGSLDRTWGVVSSRFRAMSEGRTTLTSTTDARCLHRTDANGEGVCAVAQQVFSVTVDVVPAPTPAPSPCTKPVSQGFSVSPQRVSAGDPVVVQGGRDDLCVEESQEPQRQYSLQARADGEPFFREVYSVRSASFRYGELRPLTTTTYRLLMDGQQLRQEVPADTVVVDHTSGSCATALTLTGPVRVAAQSTVTLRGTATAGETVEVLFRRRDTNAFVVGRTLTAGTDGRFSTTWVASDDHRWSARTARCGTVPGLTQARPVVTGPAVVPRGSIVTLRVTAASGVRTLLFFRGADESFQPRRVLTGSGTVRYVATRDQRWYALTRDVASTPGLTQVR